MIPVTVTDLDQMIAEAERQGEEIEQILGSTQAESLSWRPSEQTWSVLGHVDHLCIVNEPYLEVFERESDRGRGRGYMSIGPYRHPLIGSWFARSMEPPPRWRLRTAKTMVPEPALDVDDVLPRFRQIQRRVAQRMDQARGLDLGRIRFGSPFLALLRLSLGTGFAALLAHNRRHIWLVREVMACDGFPGASTEPE